MVSIGQASFIPEGIDGIEVSCLHCRIEPEEKSYGHRNEHADKNCPERDHGRKHGADPKAHRYTQKYAPMALRTPISRVR